MSAPKIAILDYGIGNVWSMKNAVLQTGGAASVTRRFDEIKSSNGLIIPGVGAFGKGMENLKGLGLVEVIHRYVASGKPVLAVCLGMQLMLDKSFEYGEHAGLGLIRGEVREMPVTRTHAARLPHVSWAQLTEPSPGRWKDTLLDNGFDGSPTFYFVHSYVAVPSDARDVLAYARNGDCEFAAAVQRDNMTGTQFHPERSGAAGLAVLRRFVQDCARAGEGIEVQNA